MAPARVLAASSKNRACCIPPGWITSRYFLGSGLPENHSHIRSTMGYTSLEKVDHRSYCHGEGAAVCKVAIYNRRPAVVHEEIPDRLDPEGGGGQEREGLHREPRLLAQAQESARIEYRPVSRDAVPCPIAPAKQSRVPGVTVRHLYGCHTPGSEESGRASQRIAIDSASISLPFRRKPISHMLNARSPSPSFAGAARKRTPPLDPLPDIRIVRRQWL